MVGVYVCACVFMCVYLCVDLKRTHMHEGSLFGVRVCVGVYVCTCGIGSGSASVESKRAMSCLLRIASASFRRVVRYESARLNSLFDLTWCV